MGASDSGCVLNARDAQRSSPFSCFGTAHRSLSPGRVTPSLALSVIMILDDAKAARKARDQQQEDEMYQRRRQYDGEAFPTVQETALPAPPAYEPSRSASSAAVPTIHTPLATNDNAQPQSLQRLQYGARGNPESGSWPQLPQGNRGSPRMRFFKALVVA